MSSQIGFFKLTLEGEKIELGPESVTIFEPPHRGDRPQVYFNETLKGIFPFLRNEPVAENFNCDLQRLIAAHQQQL